MTRYQTGDILQFKNSSVKRLICGDDRGQGYTMLANTSPPLRCSTDTPDPNLEDGWHRIGSVAGLHGEEYASALKLHGFPAHGGPAKLAAYQPAETVPQPVLGKAVADKPLTVVNADLVLTPAVMRRLSAETRLEITNALHDDYVHRKNFATRANAEKREESFWIRFLNTLP